MKMKTFFSLGLALVVIGCASDPVEPDHKDSSPEIKQLNAYRNSASARCSGASYKYSLGSDASLSANTKAAISETLLNKGYGTGSLDIGVTLKEKTELSLLLGNLSSTQVEKYLDKYKECMDLEMDAFYKVTKQAYPEKPKTTFVVWGDQVLSASDTIVANRTERSGNWRSYEACVSIPSNGLMLKESVNTSVISGVAAGTWGDWRKDIKFVDSNAFGPTKVCRGFDHQIHDQDRVLKISVSYKLPQ